MRYYDHGIRNRRRLFVVVVLLTFVLSVISTSTPTWGDSQHQRVTRRATATPVSVSPKYPVGLAVGPNGVLYVIDTGRDQILKRGSNGRFVVFAGDGKTGFSGDGGPAIGARLNFGGFYDAGIAVAKSGAVFFTDSGNARVREVLPDGIIKTAIGGGSDTLSQGSLPALDVDFGVPYESRTSLDDLAFGPKNELYVAAGDVYRLSSDGVLHWVVGNPTQTTPPCSVLIGCQGNFVSSQSFAFDGKGDLFVTGGDGFNLYEDSVKGDLSWVENDRAAGGVGTLTEAPNGTVVLADWGLSRISASGAITSFVSTSALGAALGLRDGSRPYTFIAGDRGGVAVAANGDIYVDTPGQNGFPTLPSILEVSSAGQVRVIWKS